MVGWPNIPNLGGRSGLSPALFRKNVKPTRGELVWGVLFSAPGLLKCHHGVDLARARSVPLLAVDLGVAAR